MSFMATPSCFRFFLNLILICLLAAFACAQSSTTPRITSTPLAAEPDTTSIPAAGNLANTQSVENVKWTDVAVFKAMVVGIVLQLLISVIGFYFLWAQIKLLASGIVGETHSKLYDHYLKITDRLFSEDVLKPYFYDQEELKATDTPQLRRRVELMSEMIAGLLEHATLQRGNLPDDSWRACWEAYTEERLKQSVELRRFLRENYAWYAKSFRETVGAKHPHLIEKCKCPIELVIKDPQCAEKSHRC